jgi:hypothetical protein
VPFRHRGLHVVRMWSSSWLQGEGRVLLNQFKVHGCVWLG